MEKKLFQQTDEFLTNLILIVCLSMKSFIPAL